MEIDPIKHVIVLMLENRSFDQMLGCFGAAVDGVVAGSEGVNYDAAGNSYKQRPIAETSFAFDPRHEWEHVIDQLADNYGGFVKDFAAAAEGSPTPNDYHGVMDYFALGQVGALHQLAEHFAVCDRWFSSVPGPTWANRFFVHSGTSLGRVKMGALHFAGYSQRTIYNELEDKGISWAIYAGDLPQSALLEQLWDHIDHFHSLGSFYSHATRSADDFPQYAFLEPRYNPPHQNDDHPPHNVVRAQELLASVYNAIRANEELWNSTMFVVLYDEHGGFYDHVIPPAAVSPDGLHQQGCTFTQLGVRVPALLVSPWIEQGIFGRAQGKHFDHTSLLRYLCDKDGWNVDPLTARVRAAENFASCVNWTAVPRTDTPTSIVMPAMPTLPKAVAALRATPRARPPLNENQEGLAAFMQHMGRQRPTQARALAMRAAPAAVPIVPPDPQTAKANFQNWLAEAESEP
ncbi:MAG TPA: alkaline phosphatase family protein [Pirellulales bacterium]|nr:alkaline phosphatase family protein [Pirellulales bacterium]